jgi:hypothetical protein
MTSRTDRGPSLSWRDMLKVADHEMTTAAIVLAAVLDQRTATERDWSRLTLALHRLRALAEAS